MKKSLILIFFAMFLSFQGNSQTAELEGIQKREFKGVTAIFNPGTEEVSGYYTFYVNERKGKESEFVIAIFDFNLKLVKQTPIVMTKSSRIDGSCFNGEHFLFVFNDVIKKSLSYVTVDMNGEIIKTKGVVEAKRYAATAEVFAGDDGFFIVKPVKEKKWGYSVEKIDANLDAKWEKRFLVEKGVLRVESIKSQNGRIMLVQSHQEKLISAKIKATILCLDDATGDQIFDQPLYLTEKTCVPSAFFVDKDKNVVCGGMYFDGEKWGKGNSDGIFFLKISPTGEQLSFTADDWKDGLAKVVKAGTSKKAFGGRPKVLFHNIVETPEGKYQIIGETFRKSLKIVPQQLLSMQKIKDAITGRYIGNILEHYAGDYMATFEILDFIIFNYSNDGKIENLNIIEKEHTKLNVYQPLSIYGGLRLAIMVKEYGWFDYAFTTKSPSSDKEYIVSAHFVKKNPHFAITSIGVGEQSDTKEIPIEKKSIKGGGIGIMKSGVEGKFCVYIYDKKEKNLLLYLEDSTLK